MFQKKTVDSVISAFNKARADLHELAEQLAEQASNKREKAAAMAHEADQHNAEAERARRIADRVAALTQ